MTPAEFKAIRKRLFLTQKGIGERLGVSLRAVQMWEAGERSISKSMAKLITLLAEGAF